MTAPDVERLAEVIGEHRGWYMTGPDRDCRWLLECGCGQVIREDSELDDEGRDLAFEGHLAETIAASGWLAEREAGALEQARGAIIDAAHHVLVSVIDPDGARLTAAVLERAAAIVELRAQAIRGTR